MDKLDFKILQILDWDARTPIKRIAKEVRSNKDVVAYRIKRMEEELIITRYYPVLELHKLGYHLSRFYLDIEELKEEYERIFLDFLDNQINSSLIFRMDYPYKYGFFLWTKSIYEVHDIIFKIKQFLGKKLIKYIYSLILTYRQYPKDYLFEKHQHSVFRNIEPISKINYDENDYRILRELARNARFSTVQIAKNLRIPQTTVSNKIKMLEKKGIILGYRAEISYVKLGYVNYFLEIYLDENDNLNEIETWSNLCPNVMWLQKIVGTCDIEIEVEVKNREELEVFLKKLRKKFPNIRKINFFSQDYKKLTFLP